MNLHSKLFAVWAIAWNSNEFFRARVKITGLYIIILAVVLGIVSVILLLGVSKRLNEAVTEENIRVSPSQAEAIASNMEPAFAVESLQLEKEYGRMYYSVLFLNGEDIKVDPFTGRVFRESETFQSFQEAFYEDFEELLLVTDLLLLIIAAVLSYFLAGMTMRPIAQKMRQQREFSANAAHELRNPLAAIRSSAESALYTEKNNPEEYRSVLQDIVHESNHLIGISEQLLLLSKFDETDTRMKTVSLHTLIAGVIRTIGPFAALKQISIRQELSPFQLEGDESSLRQLTFNLLHNAIKFSPSGGDVKIALSSKGVLFVEDSGKGIAPENIARLFDRFYTEDASHGEQDTGSGLGLAIVQTVAHAHSAKVRVQSVQGRGSTFTVFFT